MLAKIEIEETRDTPFIIFDPENNHFTISGNSLPEDATRFFTPVFEWVEEYIQNPNNSTHINCELEYFNSSSAKMLYELFFQFQELSKKGFEVKVLWHYEPGDKLIEEKGSEFQTVLDIPFEMIEKE